MKIKKQKDTPLFLRMAGLIDVGNPWIAWPLNVILAPFWILAGILLVGVVLWLAFTERRPLR